MAVSDIAKGTVVATLPIGAGTDGAAFDPATHDAFASNADGTLTIIHQDTPDTYHVLQTVPTAPGARNMGLDPVTHRAFVVAAKMGPAPAEATAANPRRRPQVIPGSFEVMVVERFLQFSLVDEDVCVAFEPPRGKRMGVQVAHHQPVEREQCRRANNSTGQRVVVPDDGVLQRVRQEQQDDEIERVELAKLALSGKPKSDQEEDVHRDRAEQLLADRYANRKEVV